MFRQGLIIGKFLPLHKGHIALINFAASQCKEVIVSMSYTKQDPIDPALRFSWIQRSFEDQPRIHPEIVEDDFDNEQLPFNARIKIWAEFIGKRFPATDVIISSEDYGEPLAALLGIQHLLFDAARLTVPVSGTLIRNHPFEHWEYIPTVVRPFFVKRICFYGPESTGKTTMAKQMANLFHTEFVPEVAREMITSNDFTTDDIIHIGKVQTKRVIEKTTVANKLLFCDTDLITTQIYSQHYLHEIPPILYELEKEIHYHHYFLFDIDVAWVADGLRDLEQSRNEMFNIFREALVARNIPFTPINGSYEEREKRILETIAVLFALQP